MIRLSRAQYERVRGKATHFAIAPAHDEEAFARVVERHDEFWVVEKTGRAPAAGEVDTSSG